MARFDSAGAKLIAIGVGTPDKARILADGVSDLVLNFALGGSVLAAEHCRKLNLRDDCIAAAISCRLLVRRPRAQGLDPPPNLSELLECFVCLIRILCA